MYLSPLEEESLECLSPTTGLSVLQIKREIGRRRREEAGLWIGVFLYGLGSLISPKIARALSEPSIVELNAVMASCRRRDIVTRYWRKEPEETTRRRGGRTMVYTLNSSHKKKQSVAKAVRTAIPERTLVPVVVK